MTADDNEAIINAEIKELRAKVRRLENDAASLAAQIDNHVVIEDVELLLKQTMESIPLGIFEIDLSGIVVRGNSIYHSILGYGDQELVGTSLLERAASDDERQLLEGMLTNDDDGELSTPPPFYTTRRVDRGRLAHLQFDWNYKKDTRGNLIGYVCVLSDISARVEKENKRRESEQRFSEILAIAEEAIISVDENQEIKLFNRGAEKIFGYTQNEVINQPLSILLPQKHQSSHYFHIEEFGGGGNDTQEMSARKEISGRRKNGELFPAEASISKILVGGKPIFTALLRDITDRKAAEQELKESESQYRDLVETSLHMIYRVNREGQYTYLNKACESVLGYSAAEMLGKPYTSYKSDTQVIDELDIFDAIGAGDNAISYETHMKTKSGQIVNLMVSVKNIRNASDEIIGVQGTAQDITLQKQAEKNLRQSQKMQALGTLAGGIAHDFNNVLTPIIGNAELLVNSALERDEDRQSAVAIQENALRAKNLVSQILLFSRYGDTKKEARDIAPLIKDVAEFVRSTSPSTTTIIEQVNVNPAAVLCDITQVYQILVNLCVNAGQAIKGEGEIKLLLDIVELQHFKCVIGKLLQGKFVCISVSDNGKGMDEEVMGHMFEPFFTTRGVGEGTGLGLATVFGIVQDHQGGIDVTSTPGRGTTFKVYLPVTGEAVKPVEGSNAVNNSALGEGKILFVDDEDSIVTMCKRALMKSGYEVTTASDGKEALATFMEDPMSFDLIITDQTMPNMTGHELIKEVRDLKQDIRVILCSGQNYTAASAEWQDASLDRFMGKPYGPADLIRIVGEALAEDLT